MANILVIMGHPSVQSLNNALAESYTNSAAKAGHTVQLLRLADLQFDPILHQAYNAPQVLEPDLQKAQELIKWADHLVMVYPSWWGSMPALLKGFIDRVFLPGFAFKYKKDSPWWDKFFTGKTARIILTMDSPWYYNWLAYGNSNIKAMKNATLKFCGVKKVGVTVFDSVRSSNEEKRKKWLAKCAELGGNGE